MWISNRALTCELDDTEGASSEFRLEEGAPKRRQGTDWPNRRWLTRENAADAKPARNGQIGPDPVSWPLPFLSDVFMSGSAGHSSFSLCVCPSARSGLRVRDHETYTTAKPPVVVHFSPWKLRGTYGDDSWKKGHHESLRADDDALMPGTLREPTRGCDARIEWKWSGGDDVRCRDVERRNNWNRDCLLIISISEWNIRLPRHYIAILAKYDNCLFIIITGR